MSWEDFQGPQPPGASLLSVPVSPGSGPVRGPGVQLCRDAAPPGQPWNVLSALGTEGDGQARGSWAGWPGPRVGAPPPCSYQASASHLELPQASTASSGPGRGVGWQSCPCRLPPPPMLGSSDTRGALNPDFQDSDACIEASLHPETPERCLGGGPWIPSFHPGTSRPLSPREATSPGNARGPILGSTGASPQRAPCPRAPCWALGLVH